MKRYARFVEYEYERRSYGYDFYPICEIYINKKKTFVTSNIPVNVYNKKENPLLYKKNDKLIISYSSDINNFKIIKKSYGHITIPIICLILLIKLLMVPEL